MSADGVFVLYFQTAGRQLCVISDKTQNCSFVAPPDHLWLSSVEC